jgi:hypothetical protein
MSEPARRFWIADDPSVVERVLRQLERQRGVPLCDTCIAKDVVAEVPEVRNAIVRLGAEGYCEQGLWWCGRCSTKSFVTIILVGGPRQRTPSPEPGDGTATR